MSEPIARVEVIRGGAALRIEMVSGGIRIVRQKDLVDVLGEWRSSGQRFAGARFDDGAVELSYADGNTETLPASLLCPDPSPRAIDLMIEGIGTLLTCDGDAGAPLGELRDATVCIGGGIVRWVGPSGAVPTDLSVERAHRIDAAGRLVTPGLVDPHAHPMFAGNRADEFARRAAGDDYLAIARSGGGIKATVEATRAASFEELVRLTAARMRRALAHGTTTCEAKSGYELSVEGELRLLDVAWVVDALVPVDLVPTLLGAHALPAERSRDRDGFVREVAEHLIPRAAANRSALSVDVYCDRDAFTLAETRQILEAARAAGLAVRAHAGQFADLGAAELVAELGGLSVDHVENISDAGIAALAAQGTVAVMLPGACVQLRMAPPPVAKLRDAGVPLALGTDLNPGSSLSESLPLQMWLATTHYGMTVREAWLGVTRHAARALGRHDVGLLAPGARGDVVVWDAEHPSEIPYHYGVNLADEVVKAGRIVSVA